MQQGAERPLLRGLLVAQAGGGCLPTPRVLDFLCFDTPRSVLGEDGSDEELPFYLAEPGSLEELVQQGDIPCPALWADAAALAAGEGTLQVLYRLGGDLQHATLAGKPLRLQPVKQAGGGTGRGSARQGSGSARREGGEAPACRSFISARRHTQLYRLVVGLFPKLEQLHADLTSGAVMLRRPLDGFAQPGGVTATPVQQGVLLERLGEDGEVRQLTIAADFAHACLVLRAGQAATCATPNRCLRAVNSLEEALAVLHREAGRLGQSLSASPAKQSGLSSAASSPARQPAFQSPAKPPLPVAANGTEALRLAVGLVQRCSSAQLREGLAILSAAAGDSQLCAAALSFGAMEALATAAATVLPSPSMGMSELQPTLTVGVTSLLDAAPASSFAPGRLVSILAVLLQQSCANPLLLCRLLVALLQRPDVRSEAMRQGLATTIADVYVRLSPAAAAAAAELLPQSHSRQGAAEPAASAGTGLGSSSAQQQQAAGLAGFGSSLVGGPTENQAAAGNSSRQQGGQVAALVAAYNALGSDSGSDCSPASSRTASPTKAATRSPSALSGRFSVPRLALPTCESPTAAAAGGLTRSTRRALTGTPGGVRSPSPFGSPTRRSGTCDSGDQPALTELSRLASALGESLVAADLPAIVAHKRRADMQAAEAEEDGVPQELLEPPPGTAKKVLEAHRILVTARSLRSMDSSATRTTDAGEAAGGSASARAAVQVEQIKCLLLQALVAALPLLDPTGWPARDPSPVLAVEVLGLLGTSQEQLRQLRQLAVEALQRLSQRPATAGQSASSDGASQHVLVAAAGTRLASLVGGGLPEGEARTELLALLQLVTDYATAMQQPSVAAAVVQYCLGGLQSLLGMLQASGLDAAAWPTPTWQLLHPLVLLLAAVCRRCEDAEAGRGLLGLMLADQQAAGMLTSAASHVLLQPEAPGGGGSLAQRSRTAALQRDLLQLFAALAALVGRQPALAAQPHGRESERAPSRLSLSSSAYEDAGGSRDGGGEAGPGYDLLLGPNLRRGLTRRRALQFFSFLVSPHSGLAQRVLDHDPSAGCHGQPGGAVASGRCKPQAGKQPAATPAPPSTPASAANLRLRQSLLELLKAVFAAPGSPFVADKFVSDFYIRFHFIQFLKLYHNPQRDHQALFLCRQHMDTLLVLAGCKACPHIRHRFHQLSVVDFFVRELSLEFEAKQPARGRMHRLSSSGSQLEHRRTSSSSTLGGMESGAASPALSLRLSLPGARDAEQRSPAPVPLLRLPSRGALAAAAASSGGGSGSSSPGLPQPAGLAGGGRGLAVPRLNLGAGPALPSPGAQSTASPGSSARLGRPPLPPSARSGMGATPRLTSRLGRSVSARSVDGFAAPPPPLAPPVQQPPALRPAVPKLGLGGVGRSLAVAAAAGAAAAEQQAAAMQQQQQQQQPERAHSRVHFSPTPSHITLPSDDSDSSGSDSSDDEDEPAEAGRGSGGGSGGPASGAAQADASGRPTPPLGMDVPAGFTFTGDLEEDLDRLEALEEGEERTNSEGEEYGGDSETASPTIPALRASPFSQGAPPVPPLLPRVDGAAAVKTPLSSGRSLQSDRPADQQQQQQGGGAGAVPVPRLQLSPSMHSNLQTRNAVAELQLAADAEAAKAKQGRGVLGELERGALGKGKVQAASVRKLRSSMADMASVAGEDVSYSEERGRRLLYRDEGLHLEVLQLVFTLIFTPEGQLDPTYCDQYPWERKLQNIPFILYHHLNHEDNRPLLPHLLPRLAGVGPPAPRLARVLCSALFRPEWYTGRCRISNAVGAYSTVYRACLPPWAGEGTVVLKLVDTPQHIQDRCAQVDVQAEVAILDALAGSPRACQMYDYGVDPAAAAMFLVLKDYRCSLKQWRARQPASPAHQLRLYYAIFAEVAAAVGALLERGIVHYDLKCDNCLLEPLPGVSEADFWSPPSERPTFRVVLADFGESKAFSEGLDGATTSRARGTDCFKSPEMLLVGGASHNKEQSAYDRRRRQGAGPASDVWSLGCLLYELVTGKLLFCDSDWLQLVARVTSPSMPLVTEERAAAVAGLPGMLDLLHFMLVRDARMRPTLADVQARLAAVRGSARAPLPPHLCSEAAPPSSRGGPGGLQPSGGSQLFSPTAYVPSPKATMPMPLLAALPLTAQLVLAPLALLGSTAALRQHPARRAVLLFSPAAACEPVHRSKEQRAAEAAAGVQSPASPGGASSASSSWDSSPGGSRRYYGASAGSPPRTTALTFAANPVFSPQGANGYTSPPAAGSPAAAQRSAAGGLTGTPRSRASLRFSSAAIYPEPAAGGLAAGEAAAGGNVTPSIRRVLLGSPAKVHPDSHDDLRDGGGGRVDDSSGAQQQRQQQQKAPQPAGFGLPLPPMGGMPSAGAGAAAAEAASAAGSSAQPGPASSGSSSRRRPEDHLLLAVLSDAELSAAAASCAAAGVECRLAAAHPAGSERGLQAPVALADWVTETALPLVHGGGSSGGQEGRPVLVAVQAGCEAEGALLAVAHLMQHRQVSLYQAMVAASQWGIDLHLRQQHLLALQHWAAGGGRAM